MTPRIFLSVALIVVTASALSAEPAASQPAPLVVGETFTIESGILHETRRINIYLPPGYAESPAIKVPVLYMPDGGLAEDFLHVAGLVQVGAGNGTMRPFLLVGIENTQRRRDLTPSTENAEDRKVAPVVGGAAAFRNFLRDELMPLVRARYRTTGEAAIVGESLAGLFVIDTLFTEPGMFDTYIALDPSLWWNDQKLIAGAATWLKAQPDLKKTLWYASSSESHGNGKEARFFAQVLAIAAPAGLSWHYEPMPEELHSTIYHPAALKAFRALFKPVK